MATARMLPSMEGDARRFAFPLTTTGRCSAPLCSDTGGGGLEVPGAAWMTGLATSPLRATHNAQMAPINRSTHHRQRPAEDTIDPLQRRSQSPMTLPKHNDPAQQSLSQSYRGSSLLLSPSPDPLHRRGKGTGGPRLQKPDGRQHPLDSLTLRSKRSNVPWHHSKALRAVAVSVWLPVHSMFLLPAERTQLSAICLGSPRRRPE
jgi:hypothetical protein